MATSQPSLQVLTHKHGKSKVRRRMERAPLLSSAWSCAQTQPAPHSLSLSFLLSVTPSLSQLDRAQDESILIPELAQRIANGETTNVKGLCAADAWPTSSVPCRALVDRLRGTEGRPWGRYSALLYIGGGGTYTRAHADPFDNYYLQISGVKRWVLFPPSAAPFLAAAVPRGDDGANAAFVSTHPPSTRYATSPPSAEAFPEFWAAARPEALVVDLQPGDLLHVPPCWFHSVENLGDATEPCVGMSMGWLSPRRAFSCSPLLAACFFVFNPAFFSTNGWLYRRVVWPALARYGLAAARVDDDMMQPCRPQKFPAAWAIGREEKAATASVDDEMMQPCRPQKFPLSWLSGGRHEKAA